MTTTLDVDSVIERLLSVRGQPNNRTVQLAEGEIRALCAAARCVTFGRRPRSRGASANGWRRDSRGWRRRATRGSARANGCEKYRAIESRARMEDAVDGWRRVRGRERVAGPIRRDAINETTQTTDDSPAVCLDDAEKSFSRSRVC